jgi:hypothetical protein
MLCKVTHKCKQKKKNRSGDTALPNFIKRKHPKQGREERNKGARTKSPGKQTAQKEAGHNELREPLSTEPSSTRLGCFSFDVKLKSPPDSYSIRNPDNSLKFEAQIVEGISTTLGGMRLAWSPLE